MNSEYKIKNLQSEVKDVDMASRTIVQAYTRYRVLDSDGDIGTKGMFDKTWGDNFSRIKHLLNHDTTKPVGKIEKLWDDVYAAYYKSKIGTHTLGEDFIKMADSGLITEASYGYKTIKEDKTKDGNLLLEVKLWEVSPLTAWGANQFTNIVSLTKSLSKDDQQIKLSERIKSLERFCKNATASDETIELLLLECKQLQQYIIDLQSTTQAADEALEPEKKEDDRLLLTLKEINSNFKK